MPNYSTTTKHALRRLLGTSLVNEVDDGFAALANDLDAIIAVDSQGTEASRPTSTSGTPGKSGRYYFATDTRRLFRDHGTGWDEVPIGPRTPQVVTSLPASPVDGEEVYYLASASAGIVWHLRYRAASASAYKWEYIGGPPLSSFVDTGESTSSTTYVALATAGPIVTVPLAGDFIVDLFFNGNSNVNNAPSIMSYDIGALAADDANSAATQNATGGVHGSTAGRRPQTLAAGTTLTSKYRAGAGSAIAAFRRRVMTVTPLRVG